MLVVVKKDVNFLWQCSGRNDMNCEYIQFAEDKEYMVNLADASRPSVANRMYSKGHVNVKLYTSAMRWKYNWKSMVIIIILLF